MTVEETAPAEMAVNESEDGGATAHDEMGHWTPPTVAPRCRAAGWRSAAYDRYQDLADGVAHGPSADAAERSAAADQLRTAANAFDIRGLSSWWSGVADTEVLGALDRAERHLVPQDEGGRKVYAKTLQVRLNRRFKSTDARRVAATKLLKEPTARASAQGALDILHDGSLALRTTQRAQRNNTVTSTVLALLAVVVLTLAIGHGAGGLSLAIPAADSKGAPATATTTPTGEPEPPAPSALRSVEAADEADPTNTSPPAPAPAWAIALFGAIGAVLSLVGLRIRAGGVARAGGAWTVQALFKIIAGALTALLAAVLIQRLNVPVIKPQEAAALCAWALVFGYSQDLVTKKLDERIATMKAPADTTTDTSNAPKE